MKYLWRYLNEYGKGEQQKLKLVNAVRRVGINNDTIGVEFMQQDMFKGTPGSASI